MPRIRTYTSEGWQDADAKSGKSDYRIAWRMHFQDVVKERTSFAKAHQNQQAPGSGDKLWSCEAYQSLRRDQCRAVSRNVTLGSFPVEYWAQTRPNAECFAPVLWKRLHIDQGFLRDSWDKIFSSKYRNFDLSCPESYFVKKKWVWNLTYSTLNSIYRH